MRFLVILFLLAACQSKPADNAATRHVRDLQGDVEKAKVAAAQANAAAERERQAAEQAQQQLQ